MRAPYRIFAIFTISVGISFMLVSVSLGGHADINADIHPDNGGNGDTTTATVVDCRDRTVVCTNNSISRRPVSCEGWHVYESESALQCNYTRKGLERVALVADAANYVLNPRTDSQYRVDVLSTGKDPFDLDFLPGGIPIMTRKPGAVEVYRDGAWRAVGNLSVVAVHTNGLLGLAIDPRFEKNGYVYLYYTYKQVDNPGVDGLEVDTTFRNRVSRFKLNGDLTNETVLIDEIPGSPWGSGGRIEIGPDGKLYVTTGWAGQRSAVQDLDFLGGKILRLNRNGTVPLDNPFNESYVYSYGHRNPQGLAWHPGNNQLYNSEHGDWRFDEINRVLAGHDYGYPYARCGRMPEDRMHDTLVLPVKCYRNWTMAPSGMTFVDEPGHPWYGDLFVAGLRGKHIARLVLDDGAVVADEVFHVPQSVNTSLRTRHVEFFNGSLWFLGDTGGFGRISPVE